MSQIIIDDKVVKFTNFESFQQGVSDMFKLGKCCRGNWQYDPSSNGLVIIALFYPIPK